MSVERLTFGDVESGDNIAVTWETVGYSGDSGVVLGEVRRTHEIGREIKLTDDDGHKYTIYCDRASPVVEKTTADGDFVGAIGRVTRMYEREEYEETFGDL